jgi:methanogenic corrinoid protein MtbC1
MGSEIDENSYQQYLAALLAGHRSQCAEILLELVAAGVAPKDLYVQLFQRALYQVGELWENQQISVAVEHLATAITERMLTLVQAQALGGPPRDRTIIIACVADEYHQLGGRLIADLCELRGWRAYFLGANTTLPELLKAIAQKKPLLLGLSLSIYLNMPSLLKAIAAVSAEFPELPLLVGGQAFRWGGLDDLQACPNVCYIASVDELEQKLMAYEQEG